MLAIKQLKKYLLALVQNIKRPHNQTGVREGKDRLKLLTNILDPHAQIATFCVEISERLHSVLYSDFKAESPKCSIRLVFELIEFPVLKSVVEDSMKVSKKGKNVREFVHSIKENESASQTFGKQVRINDRCCRADKVWTRIDQTSMPAQQLKNNVVVKARKTKYQNWLVFVRMLLIVERENDTTSVPARPAQNLRKLQIL